MRVSRYTADLNLRGINDAHILAIGRVPAKSRVLDLGCADGSMAALLQRMGCRIWGVERDPMAAEAARRWCEEVAIEDLNQVDLAARFRERFDVVLMLDVLEHLQEPGRVLNGVGELLAPGGWGVISVPNVAHISLRLSLLEGSFTYTDVGLLDRTHLRFFDRRGVDDLLQEAGWGSFELVRVTRRLGTTEIQVPGADPDLVRELEADVEARTYQFVISAAPLGSSVLEKPPVLPAAVAQAAYLEAEENRQRLSEVEAAYVQLEEQTRQLLRDVIPPLEEEVRRLQHDVIPPLEEEIESLRRRSVSDLPEQLAAIREGSLERRSQLRDLVQAFHEDAERLRARL